MCVTSKLPSVLAFVAIGVACAGPMVRSATTRDIREDPMSNQGQSWPTPIPDDCPLPRSEVLKGIRLTGRHAAYTVTDYYDTSWASDGNLYAKCGDGALESETLNIFNAGIVKIVGDDPLALEYRYLGDFNVAPNPLTWHTDGVNVRRYGCATLVKDGVWYYGVEDGWNTSSDYGIGRFWGFFVSRDFDRHVGSLCDFVDKTYWRLKENPYWRDPQGQRAQRHPRTDRAAQFPIYPDGKAPDGQGGFFREAPDVARIRNPHFVDFGNNGEWNRDGYVYMTCHGTEGPKPPEWANGDSVFLMRSKAKYDDIIRPEGWEFYAGHGPGGRPRWSRKVADASPLFTWTDKLGHAYVTYNKPLKRFIMCISPLSVTDNEIQTPRKLYSAEGCLMMEAEKLTGPWRIFQFLGGFGPNAYAMSIPSKFISADGRRAWLLYSAGWGAETLPPNPEGSGYASCWQEITFELAL